MRIAYLECFSGMSGDMFLGALVDAGVAPRVLEETVAALNVGARLEISRVVRSGISANVFLLISDRRKVLRVPTDAITPEGDVLVVQGPDQPPVSQSVKTGMSDGSWTEVLSGLNEGDWIARRVFTVQEAQKNGFSFVPASRKMK